jgi:hypothetical protein
MTEAQVKLTKGKRSYPSKMKRTREDDDGAVGRIPVKKPRAVKKGSDKQQTVMLQLTNNVSLEMSKIRGKATLKILEGAKKIDIPPNVWRILHLSAEAISLLLSFIEGPNGIAGFYQSYYYNTAVQTDSPETDNSSNDPQVQTKQDALSRSLTGTAPRPKETESPESLTCQ